MKTIEGLLAQLKETPKTETEAIKTLCNQMIERLSYIKYEAEFLTKKETLLQKNGFLKISQTTMLYKPTPPVDMMMKNHIEVFAEEREQELKRVSLLDIHNQFWAANPVEKGNVYASLPLQLVSLGAEKILQIYGWKRAEANIYQVHRIFDLRSLDECCEEILKHYLITKTKEERYIVLEYLLSENPLS